MMERPVYVGVGECDCKRIDERLYHVPNTPLAHRPLCSDCLRKQRFEEPIARTADDLDEINGRPAWRDDPTKAQPTSKEPLVHVGALELGHGHTFEAVLDKDEILIGWLHTHIDARNSNAVCQSFCAVRPLDGAPVHQIICVEPLTLTPSLKCRTCGAHGHVTNGVWEPQP